MRTPAEIQAAITNGTRIAFEQFNTLEADYVDELIRLYQETADELADLIKNSANSLGKVDLAVLQVILTQIRQRLEVLGEQSNATIITATRAATTTGTAAVIGAVPEAAINRAATEASEFVLKLYKADGLGLSERLWNVNQGAIGQVARAVQSSIVSGEGAYEAAWELMARNAQDALLTSPQNALFKASRVMRTEMARAHSAAYVKSTENIPGLIGYKFELSPLHTVVDICDSIARADKYGLGPGVYPREFVPAMPVHPHGRSLLVAEFD
jgi:hypothetical protein